jgi:hypothetical protein
MIGALAHIRERAAYEQLRKHTREPKAARPFSGLSVQLHAISSWTIAPCEADGQIP